MTDFEQCNVVDRLRSAKSLLIPKGEDMQPCIEGLAAVCGIEAPPYEDGRDERKSLGVIFRYAKGIDIPNWVAEGWADGGVTGTDSLAESSRRYEIMSSAMTRSMCRYSLLVVEGNIDTLKNQLSRVVHGDQNTDRLEIPATRPRLLEETRGELAIRAMDIAIRGSGELAIRLSKWGVGADLVKTGKSARDAGLTEYKILSDVYPALVARI